tara:strand:+ start:4221 stop:5867 length:1647 start_codon:yes stop_codon:yes gene_type:complete
MIRMIICYTDANRGINLRWRDELGERVEKTITDYRPYFFIRGIEREHDNYKIKEYGAKLEYGFNYEQGDWKNLNGHVLKKVYVVKPGDIRSARERWSETYEADVPFHYRYCIDNLDTIPEYKLKKWYWDMEWLPDEHENHGGKITAIVVYDNYTEEYTTLTWLPNESSEKEMLEQFIDLIQSQDPDMLIAWFGLKFDLPKLIHRLIANGIDPRKLSPYNDVKGVMWKDGGFQTTRSVDNYSPVEQPIRGRICLNLDLAFERQWNDAQKGTLPSLALDYVGEIVLGQKKLVSEKFPDKNDFFLKGWEEDNKHYLEYAKMDVKLLVDIDEKNYSSESIIALQRLLVAPFDACFYASNMGSIYFMRNAYWKAPTGQRGKKVDYDGAMIYDPLSEGTNGLHIGVAAFDFAGLYPSMMVSRNISWETKSQIPTLLGANLATPRNFDPVKSKVMRYYREDGLGVLPKAVLHLKQLRDEYKVKMKKAYSEGNDNDYTKWYNNQMAVKRLMASFYGIVAYQGFGWSDVDLAASITASAREAIREAAFKVRELNENE